MVKNYLSRSRYNAFSNLQLQSHLPGASQHHWCFPARGRANAFYDSRLQTGKARALHQIDQRSRSADTGGSTAQIRAPNVPVFHGRRPNRSPGSVTSISESVTGFAGSDTGIVESDTRIGHRESVTKRIKTCSSIYQLYQTNPNRSPSRSRNVIGYSN